MGREFTLHCSYNGASLALKVGRDTSADIMETPIQSLTSFKATT